MEPDTKEYYQLQSEYWFNECCKCTNACNELINDMQNVKRKAQAFDEILEIAEEDCWAEEFAAYVSQIIDNYKEEQ